MQGCINIMSKKLFVKEQVVLYHEGRVCQTNQYSMDVQIPKYILVCVGEVLPFHVSSTLNPVLRISRLFNSVFIFPNIIRISVIFCIFMISSHAFELALKKFLYSDVLFHSCRELLPTQEKMDFQNFLYYWFIKQLTWI